MNELLSDEFWDKSSNKSITMFWKNKDGQGAFLDKALLKPLVKDCDKNLNNCIERCINEGLLKYPTSDMPSEICVSYENPTHIVTQDGVMHELNYLSITSGA